MNSRKRRRCLAPSALTHRTVRIFGTSESIAALALGLIIVVVVSVLAVVTP